MGMGKDTNNNSQKTIFSSTTTTTSNSETIGLYKFYNTSINQCISYNTITKNIIIDNEEEEEQTTISITFDNNQFDTYFKIARSMALISNVLGGFITFIIVLFSHCSYFNNSGCCSCFGFIVFLAFIAQALVFLVFMSSDCSSSSNNDLYTTTGTGTGTTGIL